MAVRNSVLCFAHHRWTAGVQPNQRTQQLLRWCARERPVAYFEEPVFDGSKPVLELAQVEAGVLVAVPHLVADTARAQTVAALRRMVDRVLVELGDPRPVFWYSTPMSPMWPLPMAHGDHLDPSAIVYDCSWESEGLVAGSVEALAREQWLLHRADVVFTDCHSLCRYKRRTTRHPNIHPLLSSVDMDHFAAAREQPPEPADQAEIDGPRIGYCGVTDERVDLELLGALAAARPELQWLMLGPIRVADPTALPQAPNIHWLGAKPDEQIPTYLAGWDVGMLPLRARASPRAASPCKPAEYLAAGKPVVSTLVADVIEPYGRAGLVWLGDGVGEFAEAIDEALASDGPARVAHADAYLFDHSWPATWATGWDLVERAVAARTSPRETPRFEPSRLGPSTVVARTRVRATTVPATER